MKTAFALTMTVFGAAAVATVPAACNTHTAIGEVRDAAVASGGMGVGGSGGSGGAIMASGGSGGGPMMGSGGVSPPSSSGGSPGSGGRMSGVAGASAWRALPRRVTSPSCPPSPTLSPVPSPSCSPT